MTTTKQQSTIASKLKTAFILVLMVTVGFMYWMNTKDSTNETYKIKSAGGEFMAKPSYINRTGKDVEEKKITLSDGFWTKGKFDF